MEIALAILIAVLNPSAKERHASYDRQQEAFQHDSAQPTYVQVGCCLHNLEGNKKILLFQ
jgi:hypothetical protein